MIIKLNTTSDIPIYVQLRNQIVLGIGRGELKIGDGLPTIRQLAEDIGVNTMTVNKTYSILKNEGYIEIDRRHGAKVSPKIAFTKEFREKVESELLLLMSESTIRGMTKENFMEMCDDIYENIKLNHAGGTA